MNPSNQGIPSPSRGRSVTLGVTAMLLLSGLLAATLATPWAEADSTKGPTLSSAEFQDRDDDGYLDAVEVTFTPDGSQTITAQTVRPFDFTVQVGTKSITPYGCLTATTGGIVHCAGPTTFTLYFSELEILNGALVPDLSYAGGATDADGGTAAAVATGSITKTTDAPPHFLRAYGSDASKTVIYWFSEKVRVVESQNEIFPNVEENAFCWRENGSNGEGSIHIDEATLASPRINAATVVLTANPTKDDGDEASIRPAATALVGGSQNGICGSDTDTLLRDSDGTTPVTPTDLPFASPILLKGALGSPGSNELILAFDGPVEAPDGQALELADVQAAIQYKDNNEGVGATGYTGFRHEAGSSRITLLLNRALVPEDFGTDPDSVAAVAGKLIGAGTSGVASNPVVLQAAADVFLTGAPTADSDPSTVTERWDNVDVAPHVTGAGTADLDGDGILDAIRVRFDQHVLKTGTPTFSVQQRGATTVTDAAVTKTIDADDADKACPTAAGTAVVAPRADEVWLCIAQAAALAADATPHVGFDGVGVADAYTNAAVSFGGLVAADEVGGLTLTVRTLDWFDFDGGAATATAPRRSNGLLDTLELVFSGPVDDGGTGCLNLDAADWRVGTAALVPAFMETYVPPPREGDANGWEPGSCMGPSNRRDGPTVYLVFDETQAWDTAFKPSLHHLGDVDGDGRVLTGTGTGRFPATPTEGIASVDTANPVLLSASASSGHDQVTLTFSEPVKGLGTLRVLPGDLAYLDRNPGAASSFTATNSLATGSRVIQATTNVPPTAADLAAGGDAVRPKYAAGTGGNTHPSGSTIVDLDGNKVVYRDFTGTTAVDLVTPIEDRSSPFLTALISQDGNKDGFIDRVKLSFNEDVRGSGTDGCVDEELWSIRVDDGSAVPATRVIQDPEATSCAESKTLFVEFDGVAAGAGTGSTVEFSYVPPSAGQSGVEDQDGNDLTPLEQQTAVDGASPVLLKLDGTATPPGQDAEAQTVDSNGDGVIDALRVLFSEPVAPTSLKAGDWKVATSAGTVADVRAEAGNFVRVLLNVPGNAAADTSATPALTYDPTDATQGVRDAMSNVLDATRYKGTGSELATVDGAGPAILPTGTGLVGDTLTLAFSEPVFNKQAPSDPPVAADSLDTGDFPYDNGNVGESGDVSKSVAAVDHDATGTTPRVVKITLDATPSAGDLDKDLLELDGVFDAAGNEAVATTTTLDGVSNDVEPPTQVTNLAAVAVAKSATANEITLTWTSPLKDSVRGDDLASLVITIDDPSDSDGEVDITDEVLNTLSDVPTLPDPVAEKVQSVTVSGVESGRTYRFTVRAIDEAGLQGTPSNPATATVPFFDDNPPGPVTDLAAESTTGSSVTLKWTAPNDKDGEDETVKVGGYQVRFSTSPITSFTQGTAVAASSVTFSPASLAVGGQVQRATVTGLSAETTYHFAVRAVDAQSNAGTFDTVQAVTGPQDATPPVGTLVVSSSTHPQATATANDAPTFSWQGLSDPDTPITYWYALNQQSGYEVTGQEAQTDRSGSTTQTSKGFTGVGEGTWHFHVRGFSQGGSSQTVTYTFIVLDPDDLVDAEDIADANEALQDSVNVTREDGDNTVRWVLPETDVEVAGVQVWRSTSPFELLVDLDSDSQEFDAGEYVDEDAPENATYVVTLYFSEDPVGGQVDDLAEAPGYDALTEEQLAARGAAPVEVTPPPDTTPSGGDGLPWWLWVLIAVGLVGIVAAVVVPVVLSRRGREEPEDSSWQDRVWGGGSFAVDEETEAPAGEGPEHFVECPKCGHGFEVHGEKPLETTCPNCGVKGILN